MILSLAGDTIARGGGMTMEYEDTGARKTQLIALLMTALLVGGAVVYVM
ncbi:MAG TPA: hypothetical protein VFR36_05030 [Sphingomicrobium sp.]|nr:hypothetical protein [Sphingomicrobium sp.]